MTEGSQHPRIAVLVPCYNEEATIEKVVKDFRAVLPEAVIYVGNNNSNDRTAEVAKEAGGIVIHEPLAGKGNMLRRMFADIEADVYLMVDGDDTYEAAAAPAMVSKLLDEGIDMVVGTRTKTSDEAYRAGHVLGNRLFTWFVAKLFGSYFSDIFSGYRVFSHRFIKSFPALSQGFEIESELTIHALELRMPVTETATRYDSRPEGSVSKLRTFRDGLRILKTILLLYKEVHPMRFFGVPFLLLFATSMTFGIPIVINFFKTGFVPRFPLAVLSASLSLLAFFWLGCGIVLSGVSTLRKETKRLSYLAVPLFVSSWRPPDAGTSDESDAKASSGEDGD